VHDHGHGAGQNLLAGALSTVTEVTDTIGRHSPHRGRHSAARSTGRNGQITSAGLSPQTTEERAATALHSV
jgi:hypothetical protein